MKITSYKFLNIFDLENNLRRGSYDNTVYWIDPVVNRFGKETYNYKQDYNKFNRTDVNGGKFVKDNGELSNLKGESNVKYIITNKESEKSTPDNKPEFLHYLAASVSMLDYVCLEITVPGDVTRRVGDIIEISFPEYSAFDNTIGKENNHLSGRYLVTSLRHFMNFHQKGGYAISMQCIKNNYKNNPGTLVSGLTTPNNSAVLLNNNTNVG